MDQLYGVRWSQSFGNDPLGRYKNAEGERNPRMDQWIETLAPVPWDRLRAAVTTIRKHPKPRDFDGWLPDLQFVSALVETRRAGTPINLRPFAAWIGLVCDARLMRIVADHGPFNLESTAKLTAVNRRAKEKFLAMARAGDLSEEGTPEEVEVIQKYLELEHRKLSITRMTPEEERAAIEEWRRKRGLLQTPQRS